MQGSKVKYTNKYGTGIKYYYSTTIPSGTKYSGSASGKYYFAYWSSWGDDSGYVYTKTEEYARHYTYINGYRQSYGYWKVYWHTNIQVTYGGKYYNINDNGSFYSVNSIILVKSYTIPAGYAYFYQTTTFYDWRYASAKYYIPENYQYIPPIYEYYSYESIPPYYNYIPLIAYTKLQYMYNELD